MQDKLAEYADLIIHYGANVQKGQILVINCSVESAPFVRMLAEEAYNAGAREVVIMWNDDQLSRMKYLRADNAVFDEMPAWFKTFNYEYGEKKAAFIRISSNDPEYLKGVDADKLRRSSVVTGRELKGYRDMQMRNEFPWCVVSASSEAWAAKVLPECSQEEAVNKLWEAIFRAVRVEGDGGAVRRWQEHAAGLQKRAGVLDSYNFAKLIYKNNLGTNFSVGMPEKHKWVCCGEKTGTGQPFTANMPTEEIFSLPDRNNVNGVICSSLPLSMDGNLVKDIRLEVKDGKVTKVSASTGLENLEKKLEVDEGAKHFGEIALVPHNSPISNMGILFYNTLYDENASCHFALGKAYPTFIDAKTASPEELSRRGMNDSAIHVDFMVGTKDLSITGVTKDGREIPVFTEGNFAF